MSTPSTSKRRLVAMALAILAAPAAMARSLDLDAERIVGDEVAAEQVRLTLVEQAPHATLQLHAAKLSVPRLALAGAVDWRCELERGADGTYACAGPLQFARAPGDVQSADLGLRWRQAQLELVFTHAGARAGLVLPLAGDAPPRATLEAVPASWLRDVLAAAWSGGELRDGCFDLDATRDAAGRIRGTYRAQDLAFNTYDGAFAGAQVAANGAFDWRPAAAAPAQVHIDANLSGGVVRAGTLRIRLPESPVQTTLDATLETALWSVSRFTWNDPEALVFDAEGTLEPAALAPLRDLLARVQLARFPLVIARYAPDLPALYGLNGAHIAGDVAGEVALDRAGLHRLQLSTPRFDASANGAAVAGLRGALDWADSGERPAQALSWNAVRLPGFALPALATRWQSRAGALHLLGEARLRLLGGEARLSQTVLDPRTDARERVRSAFALANLGYDSADGSAGFASLGAAGTFALAGTPALPQLRLDARLHHGQLLAGPVYVQLPADDVGVTLDARKAGDVWHVDALDWHDAGALWLRAAAEIAPAAARPLRSLELNLRDADVAALIPRYAQSWLAAKGYPHLSGSGRVSGSVRIDAQGLAAFGFTAKAVDLRDGDGRFAFAGVHGGLDWRYGSDGAPGSVGWSGAELLRIPFGAAQAQLVPSGETIALAEPLDIGVLGGHLRLEKLSMQPRSPRGERYAGSFAIVGLDMPQVSAAFGWPKFPGNLSGGVPEIEFVGDTIELRGGLDLYVFDGHLGLSGLRLERPFGVAPSLGADIHFENFDLEQFTSAFSIGGMTGRLDGTIGGLRLVDWSPVAFDAYLRTQGGGRMSYNAVSDLTSIGGGGFSDNLQTIALKVFDTFGYRRLGLRCRLQDEVCAMAGVDALPALAPGAADPAEAGYTIVEGSGVPRLDIIGHRRRVDWPTLSRRISEAMQGRVPVIR